MKSIFNNQTLKRAAFCLAVVFLSACENDPDDFEEAKYSSNPDVFIDTFSAGLNYAAFSNSVVTAFQVDSEVTRNNSAASMRIDVPNVNDPLGTYAGGAFFTSVGRDLSGYNALTFWAKSSVAATLDVAGFGIDLGANKYQASVSGLSLTTTWRKYIIPIPDASKLKVEKGMFYYSEGPENGNGYSFWIDDVKFENLGTIAHGQASIVNGLDKVTTSFNGVTNTIDGILATFNMPNALNQNVSMSPSYLVFSSSDPAVATVNEAGLVTTVGSGSAVITATLNGQNALGSLTINSLGAFTSAPTPTEAANTVISIFSNHYTNVPVDYYNGYWAPYQTTQSSDFTVNGDDVLNYTNFNFVGTQFSNPTIDATMMSHFHTDIYIPGTLAAGANFKIRLVDFGNNGVFGGGDDTGHTITYTSPTLVAQNWVSLDIPFTSFTGLTSRAHLAQVIFEGTNISNFYADNIYLFNNGSVIPVVPTAAAPTPTVAATSVTSIFSDAYTNVAGTNFNPNWGQATQVTQVPIAGNNTLRYGGLNYQGIELGSAQNVTNRNVLHLDFYSANSTSLKVYLISPGPVEKSVTLTVPTVGGWNSIDIPLTSFAPVNLSNVFQMKFDGNGTIYLDNIYFRN
ncbi:MULTISPECIES: Ig-like domain-containing protein [unclassified Flavobacterium]|uniref:Ig-like domain-containing protein n=1 Tax=unclassified Flavobacterium TaxID=196869 RepID=UPI001F1449DA|nr:MULTISPECIES: Ig-like domain-containing protein [unclassified Flavobacterium]UMY64914.1 Ig-like domain-containing protein [Flavobacterium sp. HJ-32-4]